MTLKEKKQKLSKILGINLFDEKYSDVDSILDVDDADGGSSDDVSDDKVADKSQQEIEKAAEQSKETEASDNKQDDDKAEPEHEADAKAKSETEAEQHDDNELDYQHDDENGEGVPSDDTEADSDDIEQGGDEVEKQSLEQYNDELFTAKLEAKLLRANIREDRLDSAIKLFKAEYGIEDITLVAKWIQQYPEWTQSTSKSTAKDFGMPVGEKDSGMTAEEKRLKELGLA